MVRILVADEQALYRTGLRVVIEAALPDVEFLEAADLEGMKQILTTSDHVHLALVSMGLAGSNDPHIIRDLMRASAATRYVVIATDCSFDQVLRYIAEGFHGFISKLQQDDEIVEAVLKVLAGRLAVPRNLLPVPPRSQSGVPGSQTVPHRSGWRQNPFGLTRRQKDVLALLADGLSNREIARALHIAEPTTKIHVSALMRALNVRNRTEAAVLARTLSKAAEAASGDGHSRTAKKRES